jgi:hypothetical protein
MSYDVLLISEVPFRYSNEEQSSLSVILETFKQSKHWLLQEYCIENVTLTI